MPTNTYNELVERAVLKRLQQNPASLTDLLQHTHSIFPDELLKILSTMQENGQIILSKDHTYRQIQQLSSNQKRLLKHQAEEKIHNLMHDLHLPHCLDYEWWFDAKTHASLLNKLETKSQTNAPEHMVFLGAPIFGAYCAMMNPNRKITILDKSASTIDVLKKHLSNPKHRAIVYNAEDPLPKALIGQADFVFFDPPWYVEYYDLFAKRALQLTHGHISTIASILFPTLTRPQSMAERSHYFMKMTQSYKLQLVELQSDAAIYMIPYFEEKALDQKQIRLGNWRTGDMAIFLNNGTVLPQNKAYPIEKNLWEEHVIGKVKIKIRKNAGETGYVKPEILKSTDEEAVVSSVSRRSPTRKDIDLWTSTHVGLKIKGWETVSVILAGIGQNHSFDEISQTILNHFKETLNSDTVKREIRATYDFLAQLSKASFKMTPVLLYQLKQGGKTR